MPFFAAPNLEIVSAMGWVGVGAVLSTWLLLLCAALRYALRLSRWDTDRIADPALVPFCEDRRYFLTDPRVTRRERVAHMMRTEVTLPSLLLCCGRRGLWRANHPFDVLQRLSVLACSACVALAVSLYWIRASGVAAEELRAQDYVMLGVFAVGVLAPPLWLLETAFAWLRRPVLDIIELGLEGASERANWKRLLCMPKRVVPYRVAERWLSGKKVSPAAGAEAMRCVEQPYFDRRMDGAAIPRLLGAQAAGMRRHEPWLWHMGAAWLCWAQLEDDERREVGHGGSLWVMEHMASHGRLAGKDAFGPNGLTAQGGEAGEALTGMSGRSVQGEAEYRLWHALSLCGEILAQLDGWHASTGQLKSVAKSARKDIAKQQKQRTTGKLWVLDGGGEGSDPMKVAAAAAVKLTVRILGLPPPSLANGATAEESAERLINAALAVCNDCAKDCAAWRGPDDPRFVAALHRASRGIWVMVRDRLFQHIKEPLAPPAPLPAKPFAQRSLRPGEDAAAAPIIKFL